MTLIHHKYRNHRNAARKLDDNRRNRWCWELWATKRACGGLLDGGLVGVGWSWWTVPRVVHLEVFSSNHCTSCIFLNFLTITMSLSTAGAGGRGRIIGASRCHCFSLCLVTIHVSMITNHLCQQRLEVIFLSIMSSAIIKGEVRRFFFICSKFLLAQN